MSTDKSTRESQAGAAKRHREGEFVLGIRELAGPFPARAFRQVMDWHDSGVTIPASGVPGCISVTTPDWAS